MAFSQFRTMDLGGCGGVSCGLGNNGSDGRSLGEDDCLLRYNMKHVNGVLAVSSYFSFTPNGGYLCLNVNATPAACDAGVFDWTMGIVGRHKCITRVNLDRDLASDAGGVRTRILQTLMVDMYWIKDARLKNDCGLEMCTWRDMNSLQVMHSTAGASHRGWANATVRTVRGELMMSAVAEGGGPHSSPPRLHGVMARTVFLKTPLDCSALSDSMYGNRRVGELVVHSSHLNVDPQRFFDVRDLVESMSGLERISWIFDSAPAHYCFLSPLLEACKSLVRVNVHVCECEDENCGSPPRRDDEGRRAGGGVARFLTEALMRYPNAYFVLPMSDFELKNARLLRYHTRDPTLGLRGDQLDRASAVMSLTFEERGIGATKHRYHDRVIVFRSPASCAAVKRAYGGFQQRNQPPPWNRHSRQHDRSRGRRCSPERKGNLCYHDFPSNFFQTMDSNCLTSLHLDGCTNYRVLTMAATYVSMKNVCQITHLSFNGMITYVMLNALHTNSSVRVVVGTLRVQTINELNALTAMLRANKTLMCVEELVMGDAALSASAAEFEQLRGAMVASENVTRVGVDSMMRHPSTAAHAAFILDAVAKRGRPDRPAGDADFVFFAPTPARQNARDVSTTSFYSRITSGDKETPGSPQQLPLRFVGAFSPLIKRRLSHEDDRVADEVPPPKQKVVLFPPAPDSAGETSFSGGSAIQISQDGDSDSSEGSGKLQIIIPDVTD